ncbi:hypothetical protein pb186bvf_014324 [Paramecium bursaria]
MNKFFIMVIYMENDQRSFLIENEQQPYPNIYNYSSSQIVIYFLNIYYRQSKCVKISQTFYLSQIIFSSERTFYVNQLHCDSTILEIFFSFILFGYSQSCNLSYKDYYFCFYIKLSFYL